MFLSYEIEIPRSITSFDTNIDITLVMCTYLTRNIII